jgi:hypothetical protein
MNYMTARTRMQGRPAQGYMLVLPYVDWQVATRAHPPDEAWNLML